FDNSRIICTLEPSASLHPNNLWTLVVGSRFSETEQFPDDIEKRPRSGYAHEGAAGGLCRLGVSFVVANEAHTCEIEAEVFLRLQQHSRLWLPAVATFVPAMRAIVDSIDATAGGKDVAFHLGVNRFQRAARHRAAANAGLIRRHENTVAGAAQKTQRFKRAGGPLPFAPRS